MKINTSLLVGAVIALAAVVLTSVDAQNTPANGSSWEYKVIDTQGLGLVAVESWEVEASSGWKLVTVLPDKCKGPFGEEMPLYHVVFKRPKQ